jgi:hypothetical protein
MFQASLLSRTVPLNPAFNLQVFLKKRRLVFEVCGFNCWLIE